MALRRIFQAPTARQARMSADMDTGVAKLVNQTLPRERVTTNVVDPLTAEAPKEYSVAAPTAHTVASPPDPQHRLADAGHFVDGREPGVYTAVAPPPDPLSVAIPNTITLPTPEQEPDVPDAFRTLTDEQQQAASATLTDMLTGEIYDPFERANREAQSRREAQARGAMGGTLAARGLGQHGMGAQIAGQLEGDFGRQRFDQSLGIQQARADVRQQGLSQARGVATEGETVRLRDYAQSVDTFNTALEAGDWTAASNIMNQIAPGSNIDFSKYEGVEDSTKHRGMMDDVANLLSSLPENAPPELATALATMYTGAMTASWRALGLEPDSMTITGLDGQQIPIGDLMETLDSADADDPLGGDSSPRNVAEISRLTESVAAWVETESGQMALDRLSMSDEGVSLIERALNGDEAAEIELGRYLGAARQQDGNEAQMTAAQKNLLSKYGMEFAEPVGPQPEAIAEAESRVTQLLGANNVSAAEREYNRIPEDIRAELPSFDELRSDAAPALVESLISGQTPITALKDAPDEVIKAFTSDPRVQQGAGSLSKTSGKGAGKNHYQYEALEDAYTGKTPVVHDGQVFLVTGVQHIDKVGFDDRKYTLRNVITGEERLVFATRGAIGMKSVTWDDVVKGF